MSVAGINVRGVTQVVMVRVLPTDAEAAALLATLTTCNSAASWLSAIMHTERVLRKHDAQKRFYTELKQRFGLAAQPAIRVIAKVADAYTALRANAGAENSGPPGSPKRNADHNAAINIATRGVERWGEVMRPNAAPTLTAS
jgi:hypothetical protein